MIAAYTDLFQLMQQDLPGVPEPLLLQHLQQAGRLFCRETETWREKIKMYLVDADAAHDTAYDDAIAAGQSTSAATLAGDSAYDAALEYTLKPNYDAEILRPLNLWDTGNDKDRPVDESRYDFEPSSQILTLNYKPNAPTATAWATLTAYTAGTNVIQDSHVYECAIAHTSGTFATDLAAGDWVLLQDGLIVEAIIIPRLVTVELAAWFMERWTEGIVAAAKVSLMVEKNKPWSSPERASHFQNIYDGYRNKAIRDRFVDNKSRSMKISVPPWIP